MKTEKTNSLISYMLHELETPLRKLTDWELNFLESISDQFIQKGDLSDKQFEILEKIYAEKTE